MPRNGRHLLAGLLCLIASAGFAQTSGLLGRTVQFNVLYYTDNEDDPVLLSSDTIARTGSGIEFGMEPETMNGFTVIPVRIDISRTRIVFSYEGLAAGRIAEGTFNGYVLKFLTDCVLIEGASLDPKGTTFRIETDALEVTPQEIRLNMQGQSYGDGDRITLAIDVGECGLS